MTEIVDAIEIDSDDEGSSAVIEKPKKKNKSKEQPSQRFFANYKEKPEKDMRIQLGITGDTDDGWRERFRVKREPVAEPTNQKPKSEFKKEPIVTA
jgi:hypothetical protein